MKLKFIFPLICSLLTFSAIWLVLWLKYPQYLFYQEQNQLFLFTFHYFAGCLALPGGMADYLSEFVVQFYYVPLYGSLLTALTLTLSQIFLGLSCRRCEWAPTAFALAGLPPLLYLGAMADENTLLSFALAMTLTTFFLFLSTFFKNSSIIIDFLIIIIGFAILYWLAGPFAMTFVVACGILRRRPLAIALGVVAAAAIICIVQATWLEQYPVIRLLAGLNYYRVPEVYPVIFFVIASVSSIIPLATLLKTPQPRIVSYASVAALALFTVAYIPGAFDKGKSDLLEYDSLVRQGRWHDIIAKARKENPSDSFSLQALNLALGMTGQLTESMFSFNQKGMEGLIGKDRLDNTTQLVTAEALYRLGLTNIAFSTTFDLQEAIMNDRKSGRFMKRLAECMIINGNYNVAAKYIGILDHSLFYADWARHAKALLGDDNAVATHPVYGPLRRNAFKMTAFYDYTQFEKIMAILATGSENSNPLAWQYFCGAAMLKGDLPTLIGVCNYTAGKLSLSPMPRHLQEAIAIYWTSSHETFDGLPFPLNDKVKMQTAALAQAAMTHPNNPSAWKAAAPGSYGIYFLQKSCRPDIAQQSASYNHTHE